MDETAARAMARKQHDVKERVINKAYTLFVGAELILYDFPHVLNAFGLLISRDDTDILAKFDSDTGDFLGFMEEVQI